MMMMMMKMMMMMMIEMVKTVETTRKKTTPMMKMRTKEIEEEEKVNKAVDGMVQRVGKLTIGREYPVLAIEKESKIVNVNKIQIVNEHKKKIKIGVKTMNQMQNNTVIIMLVIVHRLDQ